MVNIQFFCRGTLPLIRRGKHCSLHVLHCISFNRHHCLSLTKKYAHTKQLTPSFPIACLWRCILNLQYSDNTSQVKIMFIPCICYLSLGISWSEHSMDIAFNCFKCICFTATSSNLFDTIYKFQVVSLLILMFLTSQKKETISGIWFIAKLHTSLCQYYTHLLINKIRMY